MRWLRGVFLLCLLVPTSAVGTPASTRPPASILVEATSGEMLAGERFDDPVDPGSFSQLLVMLLALERAAIENLPLDVPVTISPAASAGTAGIRASAEVPLNVDRAYLLSDLMKATLVSAADTATLAIAEAIGGTVPLCVEAMNQRAQMLGMASSHFSGIGASRGEEGLANRSTARDLAVMARALIVYPQVLAWSSLKGIPFDHGTVLLRNNNAMIGTVRGVDGLHVSNSQGRSGVIATAQRNALRLIAVVVDADDPAVAYRTATDVLESGFDRYERVEVVRSGERLKVSVAVTGGNVATVVPVAGESFSVLRERGQDRRLTLRYQVPETLLAPVRESDRVGELIVEENGQLVAVIPLLSPIDIRSSGLMSIAAQGS